MASRRAALLACAGLLLPLGGVALAGPGGTPGSPHSVDAAKEADPTANGTSTGPVRSLAQEPGTAADDALPDLDVIDPVRYSMDDAVVESVRVPSRNGIDTIWVDIVRPATAEGEKVPTILNASPYYNTLGRGWEGHCKTPTGTTLPPSPGAPAVGGCTKTSPFPEFYDDYFVPRGYAVALMDVRGTRNSSGCQVYGDRDEVFDAVDVVDWIADQEWSNGKVGLTGGSYDGTIANGAAVEQPISGRHKDAVAAVVPIRSIGRWYDYHFMNGVPSQSHAATPALFTAALAGFDQPTSGDALGAVHLAQRKACIPTLGLATDAGYAPVYQDTALPFWQERDFVKDLAGTKAAFFIIHGLSDFNVKTNNVGHLWEHLPSEAPKKLWLMNGDHVDPDAPSMEESGGHLIPFPFQQAYRDGVHRWWLQFLKGVEAGALETPAAEVQQGDGSWLGSRTWPVASTDEVLQLAADGTAVPAAGPGTASYSDTATGGTRSVQFVTAPVTERTRLSGQVVLDLVYRLQGPDTNLAVRIDDLPADAADTAPVSDQLHDGDVTGPLTVSYAYARAFYRDSIVGRGMSSPTGGSPVVPGTDTRTTFGSLPFDHVLEPGHRLRFTLSSAQGGSLPAYTGGTVELVLGEGGSTVSLPVVR